MVLELIVLFSLLAGVGGIALAGTLLLFPKKTRDGLISILISYAAGTLLGSAFLALIPEALEDLPASTALSTILAGIILFFILEKVLLWRHCHNEHCEVHKASGTLILVGDGFHNFTDGLIIAASFIISIPFGVAASLAVIAHEVPQEVGDFGILLNSGYSRSRAFLYNTLSGLGTFAGAMMGYVFLTTLTRLVPYIVSLSAASFIYIATADLIPHLHRTPRISDSVRQLLLILAGIGTIALLGTIHIH
jgi:zinc and cadmium transporter